MKNTTQEEVRLLDGQIMVSFFFIITIIVSMVLTYNDKLILLKQKPLFPRSTSLEISLYNRILALAIVLYFLYVNYRNIEISKQKHQNEKNFVLQFDASVITLISALIILYVSYDSYQHPNNNQADIENPIL